MKTSMILISGSLGSGKTTLLRHLIAHADRRVAILMNEFGELAIDSRIVQRKHIRVAELTGGCVCCSLLDEFEAAVREIVEAVRPELIAVETTGVAEPDAVILGVEDALPEVRLDSVIAVADADAMVRFPHLGYVTRSQFEAADVVLINKTDLISAAERGAVEAHIRKVNPDAAVLNAVRCEVDAALLFGVDVVRRPRPAPDGGRRHALEIASFAYRCDRRLDRARFEALAGAMPRRCIGKGISALPRGGISVQLRGGALDLEPFERTVPNWSSSAGGWTGRGRACWQGSANANFKVLLHNR